MVVWDQVVAINGEKWPVGFKQRKLELDLKAASDVEEDVHSVQSEGILGFVT